MSSVSGYRDGAIDVTGDRKRNVTIQWSIMGDGQPINGLSSKVNLNGHRAASVTIHHDLYINGNDRQPFCGHFDEATSPATHLILDARNNLVWNYAAGTNLQDGCTANIVGNYYFSRRTEPGKTIWIPSADLGNVSVHVSENVRQESTENINSRSNRSAWPLAAPAPATTDARSAAKLIIDPKLGAGARNLPAWGLDQKDQQFIDDINAVSIP